MSALTSEILFEKFQVIEVLKKDEHAAVFLANHVYLSKKIILKVLNTLKMPDPSMVERFKREAKILAQLDHPNIIKVFDFGMSKEFFYISFEYIEGESLRTVFKTKTLTQEQKEHLMIQFLKGLDYAHKNQIIHRDIKPENIFIDKNLNVKLGDFGLALSAEDNFVTNPYSIIGTPSYMSPEQVRGAKLTAQSDLFSAGVVLFELFTGKNPFLKDNVSLTLNEINSFDENLLEEKLYGVQENIKKIILVLLKKNISQRYDTAEEILDELNVQIDQPTIVVRNVNREGTKSKLAWMLIIVIVLVTAGIIFYPRIKEDQPNSAKQNADKNSLQQSNDQQNQIGIEKKQGEPVKDQVDLNKINQPLDNTKTQQQAQNENQKNNDSSQNKSLGYGWLDVKCFPYAQVFINADNFGTTPIKPLIYLPEKEYTVKLVHPDYPPYTTTVLVKADQITQLKFSFDSVMGFISFRVNPWGDVYINNERKGQTPLSGFFKVVPGAVKITIKNPDYREIDTVYRVKARDTLRINFALKKK